jgi:glycosyltransferase involved in cell wall biosynthesis
MNQLKVIFPLIQGDSGSDIFTHNLKSGLNRKSVTADIQYLPPWSGFIPSLGGRLCDSSGYDLTHANTWNGYAFRGTNPLVLTCHLMVFDPAYDHYRSLSQRLYHSLIFQYEKQGFSVADNVICISQDMQKKIEEIYGYSDSLLIYNGIDNTIFKPETIDKLSLCKKYGIPPDKRILFFSGNPTRRKGGDLLPDIMNELGDDYVLVLTGGLRERGKYCYPNILIVGKVELIDLISLYNLSDLFLFPTRLEGFCLSILEAMACGKPIVTTNTSSLPEQVVEGKGGFLCPIDDVKAYADAVRHLAEDENLSARMGRFNRQRILDMFTLEKMTNEYVNVYTKII